MRCRAMRGRGRPAASGTTEWRAWRHRRRSWKREERALSVRSDWRSSQLLLRVRRGGLLDEHGMRPLKVDDRGEGDGKAEKEQKEEEKRGALLAFVVHVHLASRTLSHTEQRAPGFTSA